MLAGVSKSGIAGAEARMNVSGRPLQLARFIRDRNRRGTASTGRASGQNGIIISLQTS